MNAQDRYETFHESASTKVSKVRVNTPKKLFKIGDIVSLVYKPTGQSTKKNHLYEHKFGDWGSGVRGNPKLPVLACDENGEMYLLRGGSRYKIKDWIYG